MGLPEAADDHLTALIDKFPRNGNRLVLHGREHDTARIERSTIPARQMVHDEGDAAVPILTEPLARMEPLMMKELMTVLVVGTN